jgi:hypothetical protein
VKLDCLATGSFGVHYHIDLKVGESLSSPVTRFFVQLEYKFPEIES